MELTLKNIGKIHDSTVEINGITVIAGQNNTGKSTVGRALFAMFNGFFNLSQKIADERIESIANIFAMVTKIPFFAKNNALINQIKEKFNSHKDDFLNSDITSQRHEVVEILETIDENLTYSEEELDNIIYEIKERLEITDDTLRKKILKNIFDIEFNRQICNIFSDDIAEIELKIKRDSLHVTITPDDDIAVVNNANLSIGTEAIYIDDPFVLDEKISLFLSRLGKYPNHQIHLRLKLYETKEDVNLLDEIITDDKINMIYDKLASFCSGIITRDKRLGLFYNKKGTDKKLNVRNLSAGNKTFVILKILLTNDIIKKNGVIILDEPEIHLHPEWQLVFAEIIVLLHKYFGLHILLTTHSPYFLNALEVYSVKHGVDDKCRYYLAINEGDAAKLDEVSDNLQSIYAELSRPLQDLEDERGEL